MEELPKRRFIRILVGGLAGLFKAPAQTKTFSSDVKVINFFASVRDSQGRIRRDLAKDNFSLEVDGRRQSIDYFAHGLPLSIALLIDTSGSMQRVLDEEIGGIRLLTAHLLQGQRNEACLLSFSQRAVLRQRFTSAPLLFLSTLSHLRVDINEDDQTKLFDALSLVSSKLLEPRAGRKAIVLISDCVDTASTVSLDGAIEAAQRADVAVYALRVLDRNLASKLLGDDPLPAPREVRQLQQRLEHDSDQAWMHIQSACERTGGMAVSTLEGIEEELENQYSLGFNVTPATDTRGAHEMHVSVTKPGFAVRSKDTYYM